MTVSDPMKNRNIKGDIGSSSSRNEMLLYLVIWFVIAALPVALELWKFMNSSEFEWTFVIRWWIGMVPLIVIFLIHNHFLLPIYLKKGLVKRYCMALLIVLSVYAAVLVFTGRSARREMHQYPGPPRPPIEFAQEPPPHHQMPGRHPRPFPFPLLFKVMLAAMTMGMNVAISLAFAYNREQANRKDRENTRLQEELRYLKQQISPHFLMNVLNNIHEMAEEDTREAQNMILELSYLMRYVLYESEHDMTTLAAESRFISSYVALMKKRYVEDIVRVSINIEEDAPEDVRIPPLLFVTFIENAFKHGVSYLNETVININLRESGGNVFFSCDNTIPQGKQAGVDTGGIGLANVRRRLDLLYGKNYSLTISEDHDRYSVSLLIPSI